MMWPGAGRVALPCAILSLFGVVANASAPAPAVAQGFSTAQSDYVEYCGGCHGIQGRSAPAPIPELRERVGWFLCTPEGREYLIRLPNVSHVPLADNDEVASLMNFVVFGLGGASAPSGARPFDAAEVQQLRARALKPGIQLQAMRQRIVADLVRRCGAPRQLMDHFSSSVAPAAGTR